MGGSSRPAETDERVLLAHGAGGRLMAELIDGLFRRHLGFDGRGDDCTLLDLPAGGGLAFTTDSYVVDPIFFPGGDIGRLAVCGTVNDLATAGARPVALSASFILEEGLPLEELDRVVASMAAAAREAKVRVLTGDTKVVPRGQADKLFITTSGVGLRPEGRIISGREAKPGDRVLVSGTVGDHGLAVLSAREGLRFDSPLVSDCAPLADMVEATLAAAEVHCLRDPTRGGLASALNEIAAQSGVCLEIEEAAVPVAVAVRAACEMLGLDPLGAACEGKMLALVPPEAASAALEALRGHAHGRAAAEIGRVLGSPPGRVYLRTITGAQRPLERPLGEQMPRIC
jgi:hydrogenase expression/formation protein HypE